MATIPPVTSTASATVPADVAHQNPRAGVAPAEPLVAGVESPGLLVAVRTCAVRTCMATTTAAAVAPSSHSATRTWLPRASSGRSAPAAVRAGPTRQAPAASSAVTAAVSQAVQPVRAGRPIRRAIHHAPASSSGPATANCSTRLSNHSRPSGSTWAGRSAYQLPSAPVSWPRATRSNQFPSCARPATACGPSCRAWPGGLSATASPMVAARVNSSSGTRCLKWSRYAVPRPKAARSCFSRAAGGPSSWAAERSLPSRRDHAAPSRVRVVR